MRRRRSRKTGAELGGALGIAILGSIGTALYRRDVTDAVPAGVPPEAAEAARDTLGGAVSAANDLPDALAAALLDSARDAFTLGLQVAALVSAVVAAGTALLVVLLLRRAGSQPAAEPVVSRAVAVPEA